MRKPILASCLVLFGSLSVDAEEWAQFRGNDGSGVYAGKNLPEKWSENQGVLWQSELFGQSNSSPAVTANRVDLTTQSEDRSLWVLSFSKKNGELIRKTQVGNGTLAAKGPTNLYAHRHNAATPSPVADAKNTWAFFGSGLLVCLRADNGEVVWKKDMNKLYGNYDITFGMGSSPRLWKDLLIINCLTKGPSYVVAFNKATGEQVWHVERNVPAKDDGPDAYSTPCILNIDGRDVLLISGSDHVNAYDPRTGKQFWVSGGLTIESPYGRIIASATGLENIVIATTGNPGGGGLGHMIALGGIGSGDVTKTNRLWSFPKSSPDSSTPVCYQGRVYLVTDSGIGACLDIKTGKVLWQQRLGKGPYHASLVAGDNKIYFQSAAGGCTVVKADEKGTILATNQLPGDSFYASPAISQHLIFQRSYDRLYAIGSAKP